MKKMLSVLLFSLFIVTNLTTNHASALTYNNSIDLEYIFVPTVRVSFDTNTGFVIEDLAPGTAAYSNTVTVTAGSNMADGYNLLASVGDSTDANRNNNRLVNADNVNYFESVAANANLELSALGENKWGYAVYDSVNSTWSNYNGLPAVSANNANDVTLTSANSAGSTDVVMKIGASATNTQVAGEFTNKINFFVTTNVVTYDYSITYNANDGSDGSSVANMPTNVAGSLNTGDTLQTSSSIPTRSNYLFFGWCDGTVDNTTNGTITSPVCTNGNVYQANGYIKIANALKTDGTNNTLNSIALTAMWGKYAMQNVDLWSKDIKINEEVTAIDERDGTEYWVARLCMDATTPANCVNGNTDADDTYSRLWMTENLDLTIDNNTTYTHGDTDLGWADNNTGATWTPSVGTGTITNFASGNPANSLSGWTKTYTAPYQAEGNNGANEIYVRKAIKYEGLDACVSDVVLKESMTQTNAVKDCKHYHVGNYYNWSAAVANNNTGSYTQDRYVMPNSICPAGWRLPNGLTGETGAIVMSEFNQLLKAYGVVGTALNAEGVDLSGGQNVGYASGAFNNKMIVSPLYFVRSGNLGGTILYNFTLSGNYWSSTVNSSSLAYSLIFYSGGLGPANRYNRFSGASVRCVAR